jgi:hypothetical protein
MKVRFTIAFLTYLIFASAISPANAAFHLWQLKEAFSNADGSVQFIEMFNSFAFENVISGFSLQAVSDGVTKNFAFPTDLVGSTSGNIC